MARLAGHPSTLFCTSATGFCAFFTVVDIVPLTFLGTCVAYSRAKVAELFSKLAVHRHQRGRSPADGGAFSIYLSAACHHLYVGFSKVGCGTELACLGAPHAGIYAALPFCILKTGSITTHASFRRSSY